MIQRSDHLHTHKLFVVHLIGRELATIASFKDGSDLLSEDPGERTLELHAVRIGRIHTASDPGHGSEIIVGPSGHWCVAKLISAHPREVTSERPVVIKVFVLFLVLEEQALVSEGTGDDLASGSDVGDVLDSATLAASIGHILCHHREEYRAFGDVLQLLGERNLDVSDELAGVGPKLLQIWIRHEP